MRISARVFAVVFSIIFLLLPNTSYLIPTTQVFAQTTSTSVSSLMQTDGNVPLNISTLTQGVFLGMLSSVTCMLGGIDYMTPTHTCLTFNPKTQKYSYAPTIGGGVLGMEAGGIALAFTKPLGTSDYINYLADNFGLVKKANAAGGGIGFDQLSPITSLWIAFRNIAYLLFVIIFVVIGFAIMLRAKIDPRTVMTIENQIPKLIVALILITFSFAIAGLMIDIMWLLIYLIINLFAGLDPVLRQQLGVITTTVKDNPFNFVDTLNNGPFGFIGIAQQAAGGVKDTANVIAFNIFQNAGFLKVLVYSLFGAPVLISCAAGAFFNTIGGGIANAVSNWPGIGGVVDFFKGTSSGGAGQSASGVSFQNFGACLDAGFATFFSTIVGAIAFVIFAVALVVALARLWWTLIKSYVLFLVFAIFGPIVIMMGVVPGSKNNFESWIRHLAAYLLVYPTTVGILLLGKTLMDIYSSKAAVTGPPLIGTTPQALAFMGPLLGFAIFMLVPQALSLVQENLNAPDPKFLAGLGQSIGVGGQFFGGTVGKVWDRGWRAADPLHNLDEGVFRKIFLPENSFIRRIFIGKETGTNLKPNQLGGGGGSHGS